MIPNTNCAQNIYNIHKKKTNKQYNISQTIQNELHSICAHITNYPE